ncbi:hypothetical protein Afil01_61140 [Actinorhabdospora filicis]|uniref:Uncharacterized protein n=1 Tax=Actinorhabdospora filicis TaxID=1785913 RepID=A0A9W6W6A0_9ACTN|nr:hypothetical protein Afil01_61140 [Actinorhabdospora filicis]
MSGRAFPASLKSGRRLVLDHRPPSGSGFRFRPTSRGGGGGGGGATVGVLVLGSPLVPHRALHTPHPALHRAPLLHPAPHPAPPLHPALPLGPTRRFTPSNAPESPPTAR